MERGGRAHERAAGVVSPDLSREANEPFDETLTKAEASKRIDELQQKTGRGKEPQE